MPKTVAVIGASTQRNKFGNKAVRAHGEAGFEVFPVNLNPAVTDVEGHKSYSRLEDVPKPLQRIVLYLPPPVTLELLGEIAAAGADEVWLNPGTFDAQVLARAAELEIPTIQGCSIVDLGMSPSQFPG
jgi:uncharacterized protein